MKDARPEASPPRPSGREFQDLEGQEWLARVEGRTRSGAPSDGGAPIALVRFFKKDRPDTPERETLAVIRRMDDLFDEELRELLGGSGPACTTLPKRPSKSRSRKRRRR